jgi:DnaK suppressor protein
MVGKDKKGESGAKDYFTQEELEYFRTLLLNERDNILKKADLAVKSGNIEMDRNEMLDEVDLASITTEQNLTLKLLDRDRKLLGAIERALKKIDTGDYGYCEGTGELIPKRRLEVRPWCRHSVKYKEQLERMKKSGRGVGDEEEE